MQEAAAGTKAPIPGGVQSKEGSPLWVASSVDSCELSFYLGQNFNLTHNFQVVHLFFFLVNTGFS